MPRAVKVFKQVEPVSAETSAPTSNRFTLDLGGLKLTPELLGKVRQEAVRSALVAAAGLLGHEGGASLADFGTFSTFSTFGSGSSGFGEGPIDAGARGIIDRVAG